MYVCDQFTANLVSHSLSQANILLMQRSVMQFGADFV